MISALSGKRRLYLAVAALAIVSTAIWLVWSSREAPGARAQRLLAEARAFIAVGDKGLAEKSALAALESDATLGEAALLAAECATARRDYESAVRAARRVPAQDSRLRKRALLLDARLNRHRLHRFSDAERAYREALEIDENDVEANTEIATLLGLCGRRSEAIPFVLRIMRAGESTDLLILLAREGGGISDAASLNAAREAAPDDPNPLIGLAWQASANNRTDEAIALLRKALRLDPKHVAANVALGMRLFDAARFEELARWRKDLPPAADDFAETWLVRGRIAEEAGDVKGAIRCYRESVLRGPESKAANFRLARLLAEEGREADSERFSEQVRRIQRLEQVQDRILFSDAAGDLDSALELAKEYESVGRIWEAYGWCLLADGAGTGRADVAERLSALRNAAHGLPLRLTADSGNPARSVDLSEYPLPSQPNLAPSTITESVEAATRPVSFRDDAAELRFRYFNGTAGPATRRMFEFTGGGIGILDLDADGDPDLIFTQGRPWPPNASNGEYSDRLFRNLAGTKFADVTASAGLREDDFGQGVAVGDYDADGFADFYVGNIGQNRLWKNNGDGTFSDVTFAAQPAEREWTTSCLLADLSGDGLPDIYAVNYVAGPDVFDRICGSAADPKLCMPYDFEPQGDRLWINDGTGGFSDATSDLAAAAPGGKGLGIAAWDDDGDGRLEVMVANDTTPNFFLTFKPTPGELGPRDLGFPSGLALNGDGKATGCMGIALGDADDDGRLDAFVTNFLAEGSTLYLAQDPGLFEDRTRDAGLYGPSLDVLGFGTQFLDADNDGRLELFVANGHIDDLRRSGRPYEMPAQLFRRRNRGFVEADPVELGPYFRKKWLGRAVARLDWNRDGLEDLAVGHLSADSSLLTNTSPSPGRFFTVRLSGVRSNRDAIGTTVLARIGSRTIVRQLTAGDGYQSGNERRIVIGVGESDRIDELTVRWPSGSTQRFAEIRLPRRCLLIEGRELRDDAP